MILFYLAAAVIFFYGILLLVPAISFSISQTKRKNEKAKPVFISIIVPVRNEAESVSACLESLIAQDYPDELFEIILIDDHSTDETYTIAKQIAAQNPKIRLLQNAESEHGKKAAITKAVGAAKGEIIAATDGDSRAGSKWLQTISETFSDEKIIFASGPVSYFRNGKIIRDFLQTELISIQLLSGGTAALGFPILANGANMAYRKSFFLKAGGYEKDNYVSGDDMMLLQKAKQISANEISYLSGKNAVIETASVPDFRGAVLQRARWLSKTGSYRSPLLLLSSFILLAANLMPWLTGILFCTDKSVLPAFILSAAGKSLVDLLLLSLAVPFFREPRLLLFAPTGTIFYPVLVIASTIRAFSGKIRWKGRDWEK